MKRLLIIPVIAALALVAGTAYGRWSSDDDHGGQSASAVPSEGIDVHGDWKIAIYNEDGSLDREYAFSNALRPTGGDALGHALHLPQTGNDWWLSFGDTNFTPAGAVEVGISPCDTDMTQYDGGSQGTVEGRVQSLTNGCVVVPGNVTRSVVPGGFRLFADHTATRDGAIDVVETWFGVFDLFTQEHRRFSFTGTGVGPFEDIRTGQSIQVQVEITFQTPAP
jgi:hypothetical protein